MKECCGNCYYRLLSFKSTSLNCSKHKKTKEPWEHCPDWISVEEVHKRIRKGVGKHANPRRKKGKEMTNDLQAITESIKALGERYHFAIAPEDTSIADFDKDWQSIGRASTFVLCSTVTENKRHKNWSRTKYSLYYINTLDHIDPAKQNKVSIVEGGVKAIIENVTPLRLRRLLDNFQTLAEIEIMEEATYERFD